MPIGKGEPWGSVGPAPDGTVVVADDRALGELVDRLRRAGEPLPPVMLREGALLRTVGGSGDPERLTGTVARLPVDVVRAESAGETRWFVAHLVATAPRHRGSWWRGEVFAAMNAQFVGRWDVAPRSHPGDGKVDLVRVDASMGVRDRWRARSRLPTASHLPHPAITVRQRHEAEVAFDAPLVVHLDGVRWRPCRTIRLVVEPDAFVLVV